MKIRISLIIIVAIIVLIAVNLYFLLVAGNLSSCDSVQINNLEVATNSMTIKGSTYDSGLVVKRVDFKTVGDTVYVYVYKGLMTKKKEMGLNAKYEADMTKISKVILVGANNQTKEIWARQ